MRKLVLSIFIFFQFFICTSSLGQEWAEIGATWHYNHWTNNYCVFTIDGEQMIGGQMCRHINRSEDFSLWGSDQYEYTYYSNDTVYFWDPDSSVFRILYDFGANPGDSWVCVVDGQSWQHAGDRDSIITHIDSVDMVTINSFTLKRLYVHYEGANFEDTTNQCNPIYSQWSTAPLNSEIIEFIGDVNFMFNNYTNDEQTSECSSPVGLRCFQDTTIGFHDFGIVDSCDWKTNVSIEEYKNSAKFYPNPSHGIINLEFNGKPPTKVEIIDVRGTLIRSITFINSEKFVLDLRVMEEGTYMLKIEWNNRTQTERIVIL